MMNNQKIREKALRGKKLIVSLTSFPARINIVHIPINNILKNSILPDRIVLYLATPQFPNGLQDLPKELRDLAKHNNIFEIRFTDDDMRQHKKVGPAVSDFPDDFILIIDDDVYYPRNLIRRLLTYAASYPDTIIGGRGRRMKINESGLLPYREWPAIRLKLWWSAPTYKPSFLNIPTGVGGTLYPPHSLHPDVTRKDLIKKICNNSDDIWNHAMAVRQGTKSIVLAKLHNPKIPDSQIQSLSKEFNKLINEHECPKDIMLKSVFSAYPEIFTAIINEKENNYEHRQF